MSSMDSVSAISPVFAKLIPKNIEAQRLFSRVAELILSNPSKYFHPSQFLHMEPYSKGRQSRKPYYTESDAESHIELRPKYQGYYTLSFETGPNVPHSGWVAGFGRTSTRRPDAVNSVDLLLAPPGTSSSRFEVAGHHASFFFDKDGVLTVKAYRTRRYKTVLGNDEFTGGQRNIITRKSLISFGSLGYSLEFIDMEEEHYNKFLREYLTNTLQRAVPPSDLSATPSPMDTLIGGEWNIRGTVGNGSFGVVNAAKNVRTQESGAAKCLVRKCLETHRKILQEIDTLKALPANLRLLKFFTVFYERGNRWYTGVLDESDERYSLRTRPERVIIIHGPFVRFNLSEELIFKQSTKVRLMAFYQLLQGLVALHSHGFMHRDIKPANIGVVEQMGDSIETVILDYGETVCKKVCEPNPKKVGTIPYLAPEMEKMPYTNSVDIWATGIVGIQLFVTSGQLLWKNVLDAKAQWKKQMTALKLAPTASLESLISSMIAWEPHDRISASTALNHHCFDGVRQICSLKSPSETTIGNKRKHSD